MTFASPCIGDSRQLRNDHFTILNIHTKVAMAQWVSPHVRISRACIEWQNSDESTGFSRPAWVSRVPCTALAVGIRSLLPLCSCAGISRFRGQVLSAVTPGPDRTATDQLASCISVATTRPIDARDCILLVAGGFVCLKTVFGHLPAPASGVRVIPTVHSCLRTSKQNIIPAVRVASR